MTNINYCKAKDPATCRYHRPNAGAIAYSAWQDAEKKVKLAAREVSNDDYSDSLSENYYSARNEADAAEDVYYGTSDGLVALAMKIDEEPDEIKAQALKYKLSAATYHVSELERKNEIDNRNGGPLIPVGASTYEDGKVFGGGNDYWPETNGSRYDSNMTLVQIKSNVNADIKEAQKKGYLPKGITFKVRASKGRLDVTMIGAADEQIYNDPEAKRRSDLTPNARELESRVTTIVQAYNKTQYDQIEGRRNSTNFWEYIDYESDWEKETRERKAGLKQALDRANS